MATSIGEAQVDQHEGLSLSWRTARSKRTQAMPKNSLFGTALENYDRESLKNIQGKYIPEGHVKQPPNRYPLPDHLKAVIPGRDIVDTSRKEIDRHHGLLSEANNILKSKSDKVFSFKERPDQRNESRHSKTSSHEGWLTKRDLEHAVDINILGLNAQGNYNRDKYSKKPHVHNYSLIGDLLAPNMDFSSSYGIGHEYQERQKSRENVIWGPGRHLPKNHQENQNTTQKKTSSKSLVDLPPNIRHKFGSRVCDNLLSDKNLVSLAIERQKAKSGPPRPSKKENIEALPVDMSDNYTSLGHTTRYNVCPGISADNTISRTQLEFNDEVHLKRVPNPDEFRYQRDELSIWVEQDVLRKRMQHKWKFYFESLPKVTANWDRNAKRPVVMVPQPPKPKPQSKPKNRQAAKQDSKPTPNKEDEIIFVTPPMTPPPPVEDPIELPKSFEKDAEFWSFYDQPAP